MYPNLQQSHYWNVSTLAAHSVLSLDECERLLPLCDEENVDPEIVINLANHGLVGYEIEDLIQLHGSAVNTLTIEVLLSLRVYGQIDPTFAEALQPYRSLYHRVIYTLQDAATIVLVTTTKFVRWIAKRNS